MKYVIILLSAILLDSILPRFKCTNIYSITKKIIHLIIRTYINMKYNVIVLFLLVVFCTFILPFTILFFINKVSLIAGFLIEIIICYYLISIKDIKQIVINKNLIDVQPKEIIALFMSNLEKVFIPILCISIGGPTLAMLLRAVFYCTKIDSIKNEKALAVFINFSKILYSIPSYIFVLSAFFAGAFLPFCNLKEAFQLYLKDKKSIYPYWLSRIFACCIAIAYAQLPITYVDKNGEIKKTIMGLSIVENNETTVKKISYILFSSNIIMLALVIICRLILLWGVW